MEPPGQAVDPATSEESRPESGSTSHSGLAYALLFGVLLVSAFVAKVALENFVGWSERCQEVLSRHGAPAYELGHVTVTIWVAVGTMISINTWFERAVFSNSDFRTLMWSGALVMMCPILVLMTREPAS